MRFMVMVKADKNSEAGNPPSPELMAAMGKATQDAIRAGVMLDCGGLQPSAKGARVRVSGGKLSVTDGPFTEAKELVAGYAVIEAKSREEAIKHASDMMRIHIDVLGAAYTGECEVRQIWGPEAN